MIRTSVKKLLQERYAGEFNLSRREIVEIRKNKVDSIQYLARKYRVSEEKIVRLKKNRKGIK